MCFPPRSHTFSGMRDWHPQDRINPTEKKARRGEHGIHRGTSSQVQTDTSRSSARCENPLRKTQSCRPRETSITETSARPDDSRATIGDRTSSSSRSLALTPNFSPRREPASSFRGERRRTSRPSDSPTYTAVRVPPSRSPKSQNSRKQAPFQARSATISPREVLQLSPVRPRRGASSQSTAGMENKGSARGCGGRASAFVPQVTLALDREKTDRARCSWGYAFSLALVLESRDPACLIAGSLRL